MIFFTVLWFLLFVLGLSPLKNERGIFLFFLLLFSILVGFRDTTVGADTSTYLGIYNMIGNSGYMGYPEPLYGYLNYFMYVMGFSFNLSQWIFSLIQVLIIYYVVVNNSKNYIFSLFVLYSMYFVFYSMNVTRQILSVSVVLLAYHFLNKGGVLNFFILVVFASLFHASAIIASFGYLAKVINLKNIQFVYCLILGSFLLGYFFFSSEVVTGFIGVKYIGYFEDSGNGLRNVDRKNLAALLSFFWIVLFAFMSYISDKKTKHTLWYQLYIIGIVILNVFMQLELGLRLAFFFSVVQIVLFPLFWKRSIVFSKEITYLIIALFSGIFFFVFLLNNSASILPYRNILIGFFM